LKQLSKVIILAGVLLSGFLIGQVYQPRRVRAQGGCSLGSIQGTYGYATNAFAAPPLSTVLFPFSDAGKVVADGNGNYTQADTFSLNGVIVRRTIAGTYTVNSDCTGSSVGKDSLGNVVTTDFVIYGGGTRVGFINTQPGLAAAGELVQQ